jgi:hypothetical protein
VSDLERHSGAVLLLSAELDDEFGRERERLSIPLIVF